jgi:hypothetical protein
VLHGSAAVVGEGPIKFVALHDIGAALRRYQRKGIVVGTNRPSRMPGWRGSEPQLSRRPHRVAILWERLEANLGHWRADRRGQPGRGLRAVTRGAAAGPVPAAQDRGGAAGERA